MVDDLSSSRRFVKPNVSRANHVSFCHPLRMATNNEEAAFNDAFCARIQRLRQDRGWTQEQMAIALNVPVDRYRKYEVRSPLPAYLIERFATVVDREISYIVTGKQTPRHFKPLQIRHKLPA